MMNQPTLKWQDKNRESEALEWAEITFKEVDHEKMEIW